MFIAIVFTCAAVAGLVASFALAGKTPSPDANCGHGVTTVYSIGQSDNGNGNNRQDCVAKGLPSP